MEPLTEEEKEKLEKNKNLIWHVYNDMRGYILNMGSIPMFEEGYIYDEADYFSVGVIALCQAIKTYQPEKGAFSTYCENVIKRHFLLLVKYMKRRLNKRVAVVPCYDKDGGFIPDYSIEYADYESEPSEIECRKTDISDVRKAVTSVKMSGVEFIIMCETVIGNKSQSEVAKRLGLSQPQVSRIRKNLLARFKKEIWKLNR